MSPQTLLDMAPLLTAAAHYLKRFSDAEASRLADLIDDTADSLYTAAARLDGPSAVKLGEDDVRWQHDLMAPITAIVGWARLFGEASEPSARIPASEAIERNVRELGQLLAKHPGRDRE